MTTHARVYRVLTGLYPRSFRKQYGSDLVQAFGDLVRQRGVASTWTRTCIDLAVTVPRYHMEALMRRHVSSSALTGLALALGLAGVAGLAFGGVAALPILAIAAVLAVTQRSALAQALVVPPDHRQARLRVAGALAVVFAASIGSWMYHLNHYDTIGDTTLLLHNLVGLVALLGAIGFGVAGLLSRQPPSTT